MLQPLHSFIGYRNNARFLQCQIPNKKIVPKFAFSRLQDSFQNPCPLFQYFKSYIDLWHSLSMTDTRGEIHFSANVPREVFYLFMNMERKTFFNYVQHKFIVYDQVQLLKEKHTEKSLAQLIHHFNQLNNIAYISEEPLPKLKNNNPKPKAEIISSQSSNLEIIDFNVNSIIFKTHYQTPKFLVYNDSYDSHWKVKINQHAQRIYRANLAFKGIFLPPGENIVHFYFEPPGGEKLYFFLILFFVFFFIIFLLSLRQGKVES